MLIMQETHSSKEVENIWQSEWGGKAVFSHGTSTSRGVAVFCTKEIFKNINNIYTAENGRTIIFDVVENMTTVTIAAIYAPNEDSPKYFHEISEVLRDRQEHKIIIGDFNLVLDVEYDRKNTYCNNNKSLGVVEDICDEFCLKDIWRVHYGEKKEYSWFKTGNIQKCSRIDFALVSGGLDQKVEMIMYISSIKTDHRAIYVVVTLDEFERGQGFWKFNTLLLQNGEFLKQMNQELEQSIRASESKSKKEAWENIKKRIKKCTTQFTRNNQQEKKIVISQLAEKLNEYESRLPLPEMEYKLWQETKSEFEEKMLEKAKSAMFRCKVKWQELGERNTKYFFALEKARYNAKTCYKLFDQDLQEVQDPQKILAIQKDFYEELYAEEEKVKFNMENKWDLFVPEDVFRQQELQITLDELGIALKGMNNNKTPGNDGIPADFYKVFWDKLKDPFYDMMLEVYKDNMLHATASEGVLNLIPKANKDTRYVKNLRPITLLNTDYKIIEKAIANKMLPALEHIINSDQRGFMKNRRISVNIRKMLDIMYMAEKEDLEAVVLSLDFVKCFDKCSFSILHGSLNFFKFGKIIKEWTEILYKNFTVKVQNNGYFSDEISIKKGVHQGGCCSAVYFLVIAEILALALRDNENIEGITFEQIRNLLNQFADDMDIFSLCTEKSIKTIYEELDKFKIQSGFTVSYDKTTLYRIGSLRHSSAQLYDMDQYTWSNKDITVLGVTIAHEDIVEKNYINIVEKVKKTLNAWYNRGLSLIGKIQVVNTLVASLFIYKMMVLTMIPDNIIRNVDNVIRDFI